MVIIAQNLLFFNHIHKKFTITKLQIYSDFYLTENEKHIIIKKYHTEYNKKGRWYEKNNFVCDFDGDDNRNTHFCTIKRNHAGTCWKIN